MDTCPNCGGTMIGDGYTSVAHCENADDDDALMCAEPDAPPILCTPVDDGMEDSDGELLFEEVTERIGKLVLASKIHPATKKEIEHAKRMHELGNCPHNIVKDEVGWLYDFRKCAICGKGLGTV